MLLLSLPIFFQNQLFRSTIRVSNRSDSAQAQQNVGPDLGPNCLQKLSADDTSRQRVKTTLSFSRRHSICIEFLAYQKGVQTIPSHPLPLLLCTDPEGGQGARTPPPLKITKI